MKSGTIAGANRSILLVVLVMCLRPAPTDAASTVNAATPKLDTDSAPKSCRYLVSHKHYMVKGKGDFATLIDPYPLNNFVDDLSNRIGPKRVVPPEMDPPACTEEDPCQEVWFREQPDPEQYGMQQMQVWLQRVPRASDPVTKNREYVIPQDHPLREPVTAAGEEDAQRRLLCDAALQLSRYDQKHNSIQNAVLARPDTTTPENAQKHPLDDALTKLTRP